ncbi:MAG: DUF2795 domain-containing protein [Thaumarchaeota archaeon]|nr:DUF2795 domain-containing protein [Nitrososphaerota archaeon]
MQIREENTIQTAIDHLKNHISYPATKEEIITACRNMSEIPNPADKIWLEQILPDRIYRDAHEVLTRILSEI